MRYHRNDLRYHRDDIRYRKKKRSFPVILICLFLSMVLLGASTYAWFSANRVVAVTDLEVRVGTSSELKISADAKTFGSTLTYQEINKAEYVNAGSRITSLPSNFSPVSTVGNLTNGYVSMFLGITNINLDTTSADYGKKTLTATGISENDGYDGEFMAFDIFFQNYSERMIYLSNKSTVQYTGDKTGAQNSIRVAFVNEGTTDGTDLSLTQELKTSDANNIKIWEPNSTTHTAGGVINAYNNYGLSIGTTNDPLEYLGIKAPIPTAIAINSNDERYFGTPINLMQTSSDWSSKTGNNLELFTMGSGVTKVRVYAWIEGQDVDCENEAAGSTFKFDLNFTTNPTAAVR